jgi:hypothetical protein
VTLEGRLKGLSHETEIGYRWCSWREKIRRRNADGFKIFLLNLRSLIKFNKTAML